MIRLSHNDFSVNYLAKYLREDRVLAFLGEDIDLDKAGGGIK